MERGDQHAGAEADLRRRHRRGREQRERVGGLSLDLGPGRVGAAVPLLRRDREEQPFEYPEAVEAGLLGRPGSLDYVVLQVDPDALRESEPELHT
ncbi:MAG TPA: hypothetical protein VN671_00860 [Solirubrobacterales bacterium]|nr:hypothetical protein [Solirubrobacterales bacterium]